MTPTALRTVALIFVLHAVFGAARAPAEDWPQFRRDGGHTGWATSSLSAPLARIYDGTILTYRTGGWVPATQVQVDTVTVRGPIVMLMGSVAGGDPPQAHGAAKWASYLDRAHGYASTMAGGNKPGTRFLESISPKAGIETDSGHHPVQYVANPSVAPKGGYLMESGFLQFFGGTVSSRSQSDIFGPTVCRDDGTLCFTISRQQWHGGGQFGRLFDPRTNTSLPALWGLWGAVPNTATDDQVLGYSIAFDAVFAGPYLVTNSVASAGNPQNLPRDWTWAPEVSGLCVWTTTNPYTRLACREGSWGQLATDGERLWTYEQTPYARIPDGYWAVGGASRALVALALPSLETVFRAEVGEMPLSVQDAPLIGPAQVITGAWTADGTPQLTAYDRERPFARRWSEPVPLVPREGWCPYWPPRGTEQVALAGAGNTLVVASDGLTLLDATTGAVTWRGQAGVTYFNPAVADGVLYVLRDDSGPGRDPVTNNCSGSAVEAWGSAAAPASSATAAPPPVATASATPSPSPTQTAEPTATATATATAVPTATAPVPCPPGCVPDPGARGEAP